MWEVTQVTAKLEYDLNRLIKYNIFSLCFNYSISQIQVNICSHIWSLEIFKAGNEGATSFKGFQMMINDKSATLHSLCPETKHERTDNVSVPWHPLIWYELCKCKSCIIVLNLSQYPGVSLWLWGYECLLRMLAWGVQWWLMWLRGDCNESHTILGKYLNPCMNQMKHSKLPSLLRQALLSSGSWVHSRKISFKCWTI